MLLTKKSNGYNVDFLGENLTRMAAMAANMPPAYDGAGICEPIGSAADGSSIGFVLDGKGILLNTTLKDLGITKPIPHVYERDTFNRIVDKLGTEDGAITTYDGIISARAAGSLADAVATKTSYTTVANVWSSTYRAGGFPVAGTYSSTPGAAKNRTDGGALSNLLGEPSSGTMYLLTFGCVSAQQLNMLLLVDLLVAVGSITTVSNVAQTVSSAALTRYTGGAGVYATMEVTTALGTVAANFTMSYTNQAGTSGQTSQSTAMTTSAIVQRLMPAAMGPEIPLASTDYGVQAVSTVTLSASMTGSGVYALNLYKPLCFIPGVVANAYMERDTPSTIDSLVSLPQDSGPHIGCVTAYVLTNTTSTGIVTMTFRTCWG